MKKCKSIIICLSIILVMYLVFVAVDCIRLRYAVSYTKPLVTLSEKVTENRVTYSGLGYNVSYYRDRVTTINNDVILIGGTGAYGAEFRLFNKILIWAWVE